MILVSVFGVVILYGMCSLMRAHRVISPQAWLDAEDDEQMRYLAQKYNSK